jgi:hypothetical protein
MRSKPLCIDLFAGLGGFSSGFIAEGFECIGFDIERHDYGTGGYPGQLVLQDVLTIHGRQFKDVACIVASPPCQAYSYRAMPWKRAKALPPPDNQLFDACFRIQREACEASGRYIPLVVENVRGAQKWVGGATWHYGPFYLWGDVPGLMPIGTIKKLGGADTHLFKKTGKHCGNWSTLAFRLDGYKQFESGAEWFDQGINGLSSKGHNRKAASAMIAKIPLALSIHLARCFKP